MNFELAIATIAGVFLVGGIAGLAIRFGTQPEPADRRPPPAPPEYFRARISPPMLSTYDGAARLQRATRAAEEELRGTGNWTSADIDKLARAIVAAWIGDEEPMVSVPIMKLGDIRADQNEAAIKAAVDQITERDKLTGDAAVACINEERDRRGLPPIATINARQSGEGEREADPISEIAANLAAGRTESQRND